MEPFAATADGPQIAEDGQEGTQAPEGQAEMAPTAPPPDPVQAAISGIMSLPGPDAIRQVYQLAASAAKAKAALQAAGARLDARGYHSILSEAPEARYAAELMTARRELDTLAGERRRLNLEAGQARQGGNAARASLYEIQSQGATSAMEQVATGMLLFLALPMSALDSPGNPNDDASAMTATEPGPIPQEESPQ